VFPCLKILLGHSNRWTLCNHHDSQPKLWCALQLRGPINCFYFSSTLVSSVVKIRSSRYDCRLCCRRIVRTSINVVLALPGKERTVWCGKQSRARNTRAGGPLISARGNLCCIQNTISLTIYLSGFIIVSMINLQVNAHRATLPLSKFQEN
jgi:hypothetical protein